MDEVFTCAHEARASISEKTLFFIIKQRNCFLNCKKLGEIMAFLRVRFRISLRAKRIERANLQFKGFPEINIFVFVSCSAINFLFVT